MMMSTIRVIVITTARRLVTSDTAKTSTKLRTCKIYSHAHPLHSMSSCIK